MFKKTLCALAIACVYSSSALAAMQQIPLNIPEDYEAKTVSVKYSTQGPKLLFSDSPEMVYHNGILYRDTVQGKVRIFFHHVNAVEGTKKLALMLKTRKCALCIISFCRRVWQGLAIIIWRWARKPNVGILGSSLKM